MEPLNTYPSLLRPLRLPHEIFHQEIIARVRSYLLFWFEFITSALDSMASKVTFDLFHYLIPTRHFMLNIALALFLVQELKMNGMRVLSLEAQQKPNSTLHHGDGTHKHKMALDHCKKVASSFLASSLQIYIVVIMQMTLFALLSTYYFNENTSSHKRDGLAATRACLRASTKMVLINGGLLILSRCSNLGQLFGRIFSAPVPDPVKRGSVHKLLCQCSVLFISLHVILWWALSAIDCSHDGYGFLIYLKLNILAGTGWSGHGLLLFVGLICIGSLSLTWASPFSEDWVFPTLVTFALLGAVHGTYSRALVHHQSHVSNAGWILVLSALILYLLEMALGLQATGSTSVFKIIRHPSGVLELHLRKGSLRPKVGQVGWVHSCSVYLLIHDRPSVCASLTIQACVGLRINCLVHPRKIIWQYI